MKKKLIAKKFCTFFLTTIFTMFMLFAFAQAGHASTGIFNASNWESSGSYSHWITSPDSGTVMLHWSTPWTITDHERTYQVTAQNTKIITVDWTWQGSDDWWCAWADAYIFADGPDGRNEEHLSHISCSDSYDVTGQTTMQVYNGYPYGVRIVSGNTRGTQGTFSITKGNVAPVVDAGGPYVVDEGNYVVLDGSSVDDLEKDSLTCEWDLDNDSSFEFYGQVNPEAEWTVSGAYSNEITTSSEGDVQLKWNTNGWTVTNHQRTYRTTAKNTGAVSMDWNVQGHDDWWCGVADVYIFVDGPDGTNETRVYQAGCTGDFNYTDSTVIQSYKGYDYGVRISISNTRGGYGTFTFLGWHPVFLGVDGPSIHPVVLRACDWNSCVTDTAIVDVLGPDPNTCTGDIDEDGDVDGLDLVNFIINTGVVSLEELAENYGRADCMD